MNYINTFTNWIINFVPFLLGKVYDKFIDLFQAIFDLLMDFALTVVAWFPAAPSSPSMLSAPSDSTWFKALQCINWVFPLTYFISLIAVIIAAVLAYFFIAPVARWFKLLT